MWGRATDRVLVAPAYPVGPDPPPARACNPHHRGQRHAGAACWPWPSPSGRQAGPTASWSTTKYRITDMRVPARAKT